MNFKIVAFDLYNTLLQIKTDLDDFTTYYSFSEFLKTDFHIERNPEDFKKLFLKEHDMTIANLKENRDYKIADIFKKLFPEIKNNEILNQIIYKFRVASRNLLRIDKSASDLLNYLKQKYHLILLTNAQSEYTIVELKLFNLQKYFEKIIISSEVGFKKPAKEIFDFAVSDTEFNGIKKEEIIYIGDDFDSDVLGAINAGWNSIWLCSDISKYNIENEIKNKIFKIISELNELKYFL